MPTSTPAPTPAATEEEDSGLGAGVIVLLALLGVGSLATCGYFMYGQGDKDAVNAIGS